MLIEFECELDVEYEVLSDAPECRTYPVDILKAKHRGTDILHTMYVDQIVELQRKVYDQIRNK